MRDRLIELIVDAENAIYCEKPYCTDTERIGKVADHLLAEGVIVPPVKVGDIVYSHLHSWREEDGIAPYQITNITITQNKKGVWTKKYRAMQFDGSKTIDWQLNFDFDEIGKTVFLTRSEAEQALAERSENGK